MLATFVLASLLRAAQPEPFHAAVGIEPGRICVLDVHRRYSRDGRLMQEQAWRAIVEFSRADDGAWIASCRKAFTDEARQRISNSGADPAQLEATEPTLEFELAPDGGVARLRNWEDVREHVRAAAEIRRLTLLHEGRITLQEALDDAVVVREATKSHDVIFDAHGLGFVPYLEGYGWTLAESEPVVRTRHVPNLLGGARAPVDRTVTLRDDPATVGLIEYTAADEIDAQALRREMTRIWNTGRDDLERQLAEAREALPDNFEEHLMGIEMADSMAWVYSMDSGAVVSARRVRELSVAGRTDVEAVEWRLVSVESDS